MSITMYGLPASVCVGCRATEISFRRKGIETEKVRLDEDPVAMEFIKSLGYSSAPVVVVKDNEGNVTDHWGGFRESKIEELKDISVA